MTDVGDDLLDGDLDDTTFGDLDGEEEDALLADDDYESYQNTGQTDFSERSLRREGEEQIYHIVDQVQDVSDGDEIIEEGEGEEDILELAVLDELDESELDNVQGNNQAWCEASRTIDTDKRKTEPAVGVSSSTTYIGGPGGESDEEETDGRRSRFKTERTNIISLKGVSSSKSLSEIPDSLDNVKTTANSSVRHKWRSQRGSRGSVRWRLGPVQRGGMMMRGGFGPMRQPFMMPPHHQQGPHHPSHKIHINPHFRGGMHHGGPNVWDNERLPPPPGCESSFGPPPHGHHNEFFQDGSWGPPPHPMARPPFLPQHHGPQAQFHNQQNFPPPQQPQGYEEQYRPPMVNTPQQNNMPSRIVQFSENTQLITVENQHFQRPPCDQNFGPNNQFQPNQNIPPHFNNNPFPNQFNNSSPRPNFQPHPFTTPNTPQNVMAFPRQEFQPPQNTPPFQNVNNNPNSWAPPQNSQQNQFFPPSQPPQPRQPAFRGAQPPRFHNPLHNQQPNFVPPQQNQPLGGMRGTGIKRLETRLSLNTPVPAKQMRFEHKQKTPVANRSNLQEIKTVDNLPDTTTAQEPDIEEDEETKQYRLKIAEQKALREKILKEKEARRLAAIREKQMNRVESNPIAVVKTMNTRQAQPPQAVRGRGRGRVNSINRKIMKTEQPKQQPQGLQQGRPVVQIQHMLGTTYKIVKVRTKEGAIVTRKTPLVMDPGGKQAIPMRTVSASATPQRRVVLNAVQQPVKLANNVRGGTNVVRMISAKQAQGRTLFTVQTTPLSSIPKVQPPQRLVIDKRPLSATMKLATTPAIPVSTLVTIDNLSLSTSQAQIQKMAKQVGNLSSFKHEPDLKRATLKFQNPKEAEQFYLKFHRKMIDLSRIVVTVVPE